MRTASATTHTTHSTTKSRTRTASTTASATASALHDLLDHVDVEVSQIVRVCIKREREREKERERDFITKLMPSQSTRCCDLGRRAHTKRAHKLRRVALHIAQVLSAHLCWRSTLPHLVSRASSNEQDDHPCHHDRYTRPRHWRRGASRVYREPLFLSRVFFPPAPSV
jgi:hypothetical protein